MNAIKSFLQGKWMGHPIHPPLVHLPVGLWVGALIFDVLTQFGEGSNVFVQISFYAIALGALVAVVAILPGLADWWDAKSNPTVFRLGLAHIGFNTISLILWLLNLALRFDTYQTASRVGLFPLILSGVAVAALGVSGYLGGRMVYEEGVSIADQSVDKWKKIAKQGGVQVAAREK